ncbi:pseudouridine synthase [Mailhella massiliensis]|uniref:Pseudouridine synthase n=1 Tax=Mailhella massiliensis TaxID=1903261 RepID=A0A921AUB5_9BACT|nr:pseudouridine synthase [Mailhella massiliensis]HJD96046.1 rRNA pseudouridine synthase [Mailhella massiliensis]
MAEGIRLNKTLADAGVCSRRRADELVFAGRVRVNGAVADSPGLRVEPGDCVELDGRAVVLKQAEEKACWLMLNKPVRIVSTASDPEGRETVLDLVPEPWRHKRLFPVGRLDYFSEGLILLSNDGELAHRLTHPRWHLAKVYHVLVRPEHGEDSVPGALSLMRRGMTLAEGENLAPVEVRVLPTSSARGIVLEMVLRQGLNRQIRRMCRDVGFTVLRLKRVKEGPLELGALAPGRVRPLSSSEVAALRRAVGLDQEGEAKREA